MNDKVARVCFINIYNHIILKFWIFHNKVAWMYYRAMVRWVISYYKMCLRDDMAIIYNIQVSFFFFVFTNWELVSQKLLVTRSRFHTYVQKREGKDGCVHCLLIWPPCLFTITIYRPIQNKNISSQQLLLWNHAFNLWTYLFVLKMKYSKTLVNASSSFSLTTISCKRFPNCN